jgi:hypothetical protein
LPSPPPSLIFEGKTVSFVFQSGLFFRNNSKSIRKLEINFNNEGGYRTAAWDTPLSYTFASGGEKTIYFKLTYSDGSAFISRSRIYVNGNAPLRAGAASLTDDKIPLSVGSAHSGGTIEIHYAQKNTSKKLRKPLIIAEPFDMSSVLSVFPDYTLDKIFDMPGIQPVRAMIDSLQYDIVYVNYKDGLDDIFRNAALFREAVKYVNREKDKSINHPNLALGISMGGLVARYALRSMELAGEDHDTWKYISLDSPHKGANLPLGLQGLLRDIEGFSISIFGSNVWDPAGAIKILDELYGVLDAKATRQMLIYYCDKNMNINNSEHEKFQQEYDRVGFPQKCQNIAVSSGNTRGNPLFAPSTQLFNWNDSKHFDAFESLLIGSTAYFATFLNVKIGDLPAYKLLIQNLWPGNSALKAEFNIDALPDKKVARIYNGHVYFKKWILWVIPVTTDISHKELYSKDYMLPLDGAAGSFNSFEGVQDDDENFKAILDQFKQKKFTFIPTSSSLALSNWQDYVNKDIRNRDFYAEGISEFEDNLSTPATSYKHGDFAHAATFLAKHLASPPVYFNLASAGFSTSSLLPLKNPQSVPVSWSVSNSNFSLLNTGKTSATLFCDKANQTGIVTVKNTVTVPSATASAMGISASFQMQQRKRMQSLSAISISGDFEQKSPTTTVRVSNLPTGIPVSWKLSDTSNFRLASSAADSAVIEALSYNKTTALTTTVSLQGGKQISVQKQLTSPKLSLTVPMLDCREREVHFTPLLSTCESIEWSSTSSDIKLENDTKKASIKVKGVKNTKQAKLKVKMKAKGEEFSVTKDVTVAIPESFNLYVICIDKKNSPKKVLIQALPAPYNTNAGTFHWKTNNGRIEPCVESYVKANVTGDFTALLTGDQILKTAEMTPSLIKSLAAVIEDEDDLENVSIFRSATVNDNTGKTESVILGITAPNLNSIASSQTVSSQLVEQYIRVDNPGTTEMLKPLPPLDDTDLWMIPPTNDPSYAVLYYSGSSVCVTCNYTSPCNGTLTASVLISGTNFSCSYTSSKHSITITNDDVDKNNTGNNNGNNGNNNGNGIYDPVTGTKYKIHLYNDYGLVKTLNFDSSLKTLSIPMHGYPNGFYYVNIIDLQGNVVKQQIVRVQ